MAKKEKHVAINLEFPATKIKVDKISNGTDLLYQKNVVGSTIKDDKSLWIHVGNDTEFFTIEKNFTTEEVKYSCGRRDHSNMTKDDPNFFSISKIIKDIEKICSNKFIPNYSNL